MAYSSRKARTVLAMAFLGTGILLVAVSSSSVTGGVAGAASQEDTLLSSIGLFFVLVSLFLEVYSTGQKQHVNITSAIKQDPGLIRRAEEAARNQDVQRGLNHLEDNLYHGHLAGLKPEHVSGTDVNYLRDRTGARLFYRQMGEQSFQIVGKAGKDKANQDAVMAKLRERYGR